MRLVRCECDLNLIASHGRREDCLMHMRAFLSSFIRSNTLHLVGPDLPALAQTHVTEREFS